jgi:hypothetical protein
MSILEKLAKIEALIEKTSSEGEKHAALLAKNRILSSLDLRQSQELFEYKITMESPWKKRLFIALCNKHGIKTYRYYRQKHTTSNVKITKIEMETKIWPEYLMFSEILENLVEDVMKDLMKKIWQGKENEIVISGEIDS